MFRGSTVERIKARLETSFDTTCDIERPTGARGSMNEPLHNITSMVYSSLPCRVIGVEQSESSQAKAVGAQEVMVAKPWLVVPKGTVLLPDDVVFLANGDQYEIANVLENRSQLPFEKALMVRQRDGEWD